MRARRVSVPIALTVAAVAVAIALTVGWQILIARGPFSIADKLGRTDWLLGALGLLLFAGIIAVAILQGTWLVREIRTNQRQQNFIDAVTHELHTPLASLQLYLDTLRGRQLEPQKRDEFLAIMSDDLDRLGHTINQILSAARSNPRRVFRESVNVAKLVGECAEDARERHGLEPDAITLEVPDSAWLRGDAEQLRVALRNLLDNAVKYAGARTQIDVSVRALSARRLEIAVRDQGIGIPESGLETVFQRFQRLGQEALRSGRGLGLGLSIVRNIARAHGGKVRAESDGEGRGSRFILTLPGYVDEEPNSTG